MAVHVEPHILSRRTLAIGIAAGVAIAAAIGVITYRRLHRPAPPPPPVRLSFGAPPGSELGAGDDPLDAAISADGRQVAFVATTSGITRIWQRALDSPEAKPLAGTEGAQLPAWKRTGGLVSFFVGARLEQISLDDGAVRELVEVPGAAGAAWLPDGSVLIGEARGPVRRLANGVLSSVTALHQGDRGHAFPMTVGDGNAFVYLATRDNGRRVIRLAVNGQEYDLTETASHGQVVGDRLVYVRDNVLFSRGIDPKTHMLTGAATSLAVNVGVSGGGRGLFVASPRLLLAAPAAPRERELVWLDAMGGRVTTNGEPGDYWQVRLSPDDESAAVTQVAPLIGTLDVWARPVAPRGAVPEQLTLSVAADSDPVWSTDGTRVLFRSLQGGTANLFTHAVHNPDAVDELFMKSELDETPTDWRGADVLFQAPRPGTGLDVWRFDSNAMAVQGVATTGFNESDARWSPDGQWVAYVSDESGRPDIYAQPWPPDGGRVRVSTAGGSRPRWSRDGRALFFVRDDQMMRAELQDSDEMPFATPQPLFAVPGLRDFDVAHKSDRFLVLLPVKGGGQAPVTAIMDWAQ